MKMNRYVSVIVVGFLLLAGMVIVPTCVDAAKKIPEFSLKDVSGNGVVDSTELRGKVLLVNFWATWCPPCRKEIPYLKKLHEK